MSGKTLANSETRIEALKLQSSAYGVPIPFVWGVTRIPGNMVWYGGFKAVPYTSTSGKGGGVKVQNTTYTYQASVMLGLCQGPITGIRNVWRGKRQYTGGVTPSQVITVTETYTPPGSGAMTYTTTHAANFAAVVAITGTFASTGDEGTDTLSAEYDYSIASGVVTILRDRYRGVLLSITYQYISGSVTQTALDELGLSFIPGTIGQAAWSGLATFGAESIGYSGHSLVAGQDYDLGTGAQVDNHNFEVVAPMAYHLGASIPDVDLSLVLRDLLSNARGGAGFPASALDAWTEWSDYIVASGLLVSPALTEQQRAAEIVEHAAKLTNSGPLWSGGRLRMVPYADSAVTGNGRTFTPNTTPVYDLDDDCWSPSSGSAPLRHSAKSPADRFNHVRVEYLDRANQYNPAIAEAKDQADIDALGMRSMPVLQAHWVCDTAAARQVAQVLLQRSLFVVNTYTASLPWHFALLEPTDLVTLTDVGLGLVQAPARTIGFEENDEGDLQVTFEDYPAGISSAAIYPSQAPVGYQPDYNAAPGNVDTPIIFEAPAPLTKTGIALYVAVRGSGAVWGGAQVWLSLDGSNYRLQGTVYGSARYGALSANAGAAASTLAVNGLGTAQLISGSATDAAQLVTLCYVGGANPEYLAYQTATLTGAGAYTLSSLVHAAYGTPALSHSSGDPFVRVDERIVVGEDLDPSYVGRTVYIKLCSFNLWGGAQQQLSDVSATTYTITGAMAALSVPLGSTVYRQSTDPASGAFVPSGVLWYDTGHGNKPYLRQGGAWVNLQDASIATAQTAANAAQSAANAAQSDATAALADLADIASDSVLSVDEKPRVMQDYAVITTEQSGIDAQATNYAVTTERTTYDTAVTALTSYLSSLTSPAAWNSLSGNTAIVGATFRSKFQDVYTSRQALLNKINDNAKSRLGALATLNVVDTIDLADNATYDSLSDSYDFAGASVGSGSSITARTWTVTPAHDCDVEFSATIVADTVLPDSGNRLSWTVTPSGSSATLLSAANANSTARQTFPAIARFAATGGVALDIKIKADRPVGNPAMHLFESQMAVTFLYK